MLRTGIELLNRMVTDETPHSFQLYDEETLTNTGRVADPVEVPYYPNNWGVNVVDTRLVSVMAGFKPIECLQDNCDYALVFETRNEKDRFECIAKQFERYSRRLPDTTLGNWLLSHSFNGDIDQTPTFLRQLEHMSHSVFGCHVLDMAYVDQNGTLLNRYESLVHNEDTWGETMTTDSVRIPLLSADGCPFYDIALLACSTPNQYHDDIGVAFEFVVQVSPDAPWSLLQTTNTKPHRVADYVRKYARRSTRLTDHRKPFK